MSPLGCILEPGWNRGRRGCRRRPRWGITQGRASSAWPGKTPPDGSTWSVPNGRARTGHRTLFQNCRSGAKLNRNRTRSRKLAECARAAAWHMSRQYRGGSGRCSAGVSAGSRFGGACYTCPGTRWLESRKRIKRRVPSDRRSRCSALVFDMGSASGLPVSSHSCPHTRDRPSTSRTNRHRDTREPAGIVAS